MSDKKRVLIVDDHQMFLDGLKLVLKKHKNVEIVGEALNGARALEMVKYLKPEYVIIDINMPGINGIETTEAIKKLLPECKVIALTMVDDFVSVNQMLKAGANAFILKNTGADELLKAMAMVDKDELYLSADISEIIMKGIYSFGQLKANKLKREPEPELLTPREKEIVVLVAQGLTNIEIADKLFLSPATVKTHRKNILSKLNMNNTASLVRYAMENDLGTVN